MSEIRTFRVGVRGFSFDHVHVRARSHGRARYLCALAYSDADWGTVDDGFRHITSCRLAPEANDRPLVYPRVSPEGLVQAPTYPHPQDEAFTS